VGERSFEEVAELLWQGESALSAEARSWEGMDLPDLPAVLPDGDLLRAGVVALGALDPFRGDQRRPALLGAARRLIATVVSVLPVRSGGRPAPELVVREERRPGSVAQRLSMSVCTRRPSAAMVAAIDVALVTMADHELATSTLAARVAASTRADLYGVILSGMGTMSGRLHGAASNEVRPLLDAAQWPGPAEALGRALRKRSVPVGFGHRLYAAGDPRAVWLLEWVQRVASPEQWQVVAELIAVAAEQGVPPPNVDFALGALAWVGHMAPGASETIATVARIAGWVAHALEEYEEMPLRFRARAVYRSDT
jgi:citrate synthase